MRLWRSSAALRLAAVASASVLVGHWLAYLAAVPHADLRDELLLTSGHAYWLLAVKIALVLGTAALAGSGLEAIHSRRAADDDVRSWGRTLPALLVVQLGAFSMLEVGERILAGEPWQSMLHHDVYAWGVLAQLAIAPLGAALLALLARVLRRVAELRLATPSIAPRLVLVAVPSLPAVVAPRDWRGAFSSRGPPA